VSDARVINREFAGRSSGDLQVYSALLGHVPRIDPAAPLPAAFSQRLSDDAKRLLATLGESCRRRADRDDWLGSLLRRADRRLHEAHRRLASPPHAKKVRTHVFTRSQRTITPSSLPLVARSDDRYLTAA
jgi:hypothetical protein